MHKTTFFIIKLWCIVEILSCKVTKRHFRKYTYVTSDRAPEKVLLYVLYWRKALKLTLFWAGRYVQESPIFLLLHFSPSKLVTKRAYPLYQCIASHTTTINKGGGAKCGEYGIFKMKS